MESEKSGQPMSQPPPYSGPQQPQYPGPQQPGPPPGFYPPQPTYPVHTTTVYPAAITVVSANVTAMGSQPSPTVCKSCNQQVTTVVKHKATTKTHLFAFLLCIIGCWPCVCIPYCMESCRNVDHYCPNCEAYLGSYLS